MAKANSMSAMMMSPFFSLSILIIGLAGDVFAFHTFHLDLLRDLQNG